MRITVDTQKLPGRQVSLVAAEVTAQLHRLMHAEDLKAKDRCVYCGNAFVSNRVADVEAVHAIEMNEYWLCKKYPYH